VTGLERQVQVEFRPYTGGPEPVPEGVMEVAFPDGAVYLADGLGESPTRVAGWYFGFPSCCVEFYAEAIEAAEREGRLPWGERQERMPPKHPVSGHLLCPACSNGSPAPLLDRPAERFGWLVIDTWEPRRRSTDWREAHP
jgi:hypothetical protein